MTSDNVIEYQAVQRQMKKVAKWLANIDDRKRKIALDAGLLDRRFSKKEPMEHELPNGRWTVEGSAPRCNVGVEHDGAWTPMGAVFSILEDAELVADVLNERNITRDVVAAALAWANNTHICSCETTKEGERLIDAIIEYEANTETPNCPICGNDHDELPCPTGTVTNE